MFAVTHFSIIKTTSESNSMAFRFLSVYRYEPRLISLGLLGQSPYGGKGASDRISAT